MCLPKQPFMMTRDQLHITRVIYKKLRDILFGLFSLWLKTINTSAHQICFVADEHEMINAFFKVGYFFRKFTKKSMNTRLIIFLLWNPNFLKLPEKDQKKKRKE